MTITGRPCVSFARRRRPGCAGTPTLRTRPARPPPPSDRGKPTALDARELRPEPERLRRARRGRVGRDSERWRMRSGVARKGLGDSADSHPRAAPDALLVNRLPDLERLTRGGPGLPMLSASYASERGQVVTARGRLRSVPGRCGRAPRRVPCERGGRGRDRVGGPRPGREVRAGAGRAEGMPVRELYEVELELTFWGQTVPTYSCGNTQRVTPPVSGSAGGEIQGMWPPPAGRWRCSSPCPRRRNLPRRGHRPVAVVARSIRLTVTVSAAVKPGSAAPIRLRNAFSPHSAQFSCGPAVDTEVTPAPPHLRVAP